MVEAYVMSGAPVKVLANVSWRTSLMTASGFGHLKATARGDLVLGSEIRPGRHKERLDALHAEIGIIRLNMPNFRSGINLSGLSAYEDLHCGEGA